MESLFPGLSARENWHPVVVHLPVALLPLALIVQALATWRQKEEWQRGALWLLWLGAAGAVAAVVTGKLAEEEVFVPEPAWEVIELHENLMFVTTGLAVALAVLGLILRKRLTRPLQLGLLAGLLVLNGVLALGADRGGQLVYQYGVSVQTNQTEERD
jgi:uncharacterized membrane protein